MAEHVNTLQAHHAEGYKWWAQRLGRSFQLYDETRIDHFRGFAGELHDCYLLVLHWLGCAALALIKPAPH